MPQDAVGPEGLDDWSESEPEERVAYGNPPDLNEEGQSEPDNQ